MALIIECNLITDRKKGTPEQKEISYVKILIELLGRISYIRNNKNRNARCSFPSGHHISSCSNMSCSLIIAVHELGTETMDKNSVSA